MLPIAWMCFWVSSTTFHRMISCRNATGFLKSKYSTVILVSSLVVETSECFIHNYSWHGDLILIELTLASTLRITLLVKPQLCGHGRCNPSKVVHTSPWKSPIHGWQFTNGSIEIYATQSITIFPLGPIWFSQNCLYTPRAKHTSHI